MMRSSALALSLLLSALPRTVSAGRLAGGGRGSSESSLSASSSEDAAATLAADITDGRGESDRTLQRGCANPTSCQDSANCCYGYTCITAAEGGVCAVDPNCRPRDGIDDPVWAYSSNGNMQNSKPCSSTRFWEANDGHRCGEGIRDAKRGTFYTGTDEDGNEDVPVRLACPNACGLSCVEYVDEGGEVPTVFPPPVVPRISKCNSNPCQNGGICTDLDDDSFECDCTATQHTGEDCSTPLADWMSGKHGIGFRITGGTGPITEQFCSGAAAEELVSQIKDSIVDGMPDDSPFEPISYVILSISSGSKGDQYIGPNDDLMNVIGLGAVAECDVFGQIVDELAVLGIDVIAYMAAEGPAVLKSGERKAWDYSPSTSRTDIEYSGFLDDGTLATEHDPDGELSLGYAHRGALCADLQDVNGHKNDGNSDLEDCSDEPDCPCAPSVRKWVKFVEDTYGAFTSDEDRREKIMRAYAERIVKPYAELYGAKSNFKGFWFGQASSNYANKYSIVDNVREVMPFASVAISDSSEGGTIPLQTNSPGYEDYTFGLVTSVNKASPNSCRNYGMILSAEASDNGYVTENVTPNWYTDGSSTECESECDATTSFSYDTVTSASKALAHVFMPIGTSWNTGDARGGWLEDWEEDSAYQGTTGAEWMARVLNAGGAFTWNIPLAYYSDSAGNECRYREDGVTLNTRLGHCGEYDEVELLKKIYGKLSAVTDPSYTYTFTGMNPDRKGKTCNGPLIPQENILPPVTPRTSPDCRPRDGVDDAVWSYNMGGVIDPRGCRNVNFWSDTGRCEIGALRLGLLYEGEDSAGDTVSVRLACPNACGLTCEEYDAEVAKKGVPPVVPRSSTCRPRDGVDDAVWSYDMGGVIDPRGCRNVNFWSGTGRCDLGALRLGMPYEGVDSAGDTVSVRLACPNACGLTCQLYAAEVARKRDNGWS